MFFVIRFIVADLDEHYEFTPELQIIMPKFNVSLIFLNLTPESDHSL